MNDYSRSTLPREAPIGREVYMERRQSRNRAVLFALGGLLVLCVCLCVGMAGVGFFFYGPTGRTASFAVPFASSATATPAQAKPTAIPFLRAAKDDSGLQVTVTAYQRPLPAEGIKIPTGQELVLVTVKVENTRATGDPLPYSSDDFKLVSPEGDSFSADPGQITTGEMLKKGEVAPKKSVKGDLIFYVYSDVKDLQLVWESADGTTRTFALKR